VIGEAAIVAALAGAVFFGMRAFRRWLREQKEAFEAIDPADLTDAQRAEYERHLADHRRAEAEEQAERDAALRLKREQRDL